MIAIPEGGIDAAQLPAGYGGLRELIASFTEEVWRALYRHSSTKEALGGATATLNGRLSFNASARLDAAGKPIYDFNLGCAPALCDAISLLCCKPDFCREYPFEGQVAELDLDNRPERFLSYEHIIEDEVLVRWPATTMLGPEPDQAVAAVWKA